MPYLPTGRELIDPFKLLETAGIGPGMKVVDCGCGTLGHYVFPAAQLVGAEGRVYAVDILKSVLNDIESRIKMEGLNNIETIWGDLERAGGVRLPDGSLDIVLVINNLSLSRQRPALMKECLRLAKPGGRVVVVDWRLDAPAIGTPLASRLAPEETRKLTEAFGLVLLKPFTPGRFHYGFLFMKPEK